MSHRVRISDAVVNGRRVHVFIRTRIQTHRTAALIQNGARNGMLNFNTLVFRSAPKTHTPVLFHRANNDDQPCSPTHFELKICNAKMNRMYKVTQGIQANITWNLFFIDTLKLGLFFVSSFHWRSK